MAGFLIRMAGECDRTPSLYAFVLFQYVVFSRGEVSEGFAVCSMYALSP